MPEERNGRAQRSATEEPPPEVAGLIREIWESRAADVFRFSLEEFTELILRIAGRYGYGCPPTDPPGVPEQLAFVRGLHSEELMLAHACAQGSEAAWERFMVLYRETLYRSAYAIAGSDTGGRELADSLYADLYGLQTRDGARHSPLLLYHGRGSLPGWLRSVLAQRFVDALRRTGRETSLDEIEEPAQTQPEECAVSPGGWLVLAQQVIRKTLLELASDERFLLSAYYLDGRTLKQIACVLGVHESTASRMLSRLTTALRKQIKDGLRRAGLSRREAEEAMQTDVRELDVQVRKILQVHSSPPFQDQQVMAAEGGEADV